MRDLRIKNSCGIALSFGLALVMSACATVPKAPQRAVVDTDEIVFTLAKGERLYSERERLSIMTGGKRDMAKFERRLKDASVYPLGSKRNPVRASMPQGQREYLDRLRCALDSQPPRYERVGNVGMGPYETIIDHYEAICTGEAPYAIYMDMYFPGHVETEAVPGFAILLPTARA